jgi:hypothetical protein
MANIIIQATQEAEIRRIAVQGQHRQKVRKTPSQQKRWRIIPAISATWET